MQLNHCFRAVTSPSPVTVFTIHFYFTPQIIRPRSPRKAQSHLVAMISPRPSDNWHGLDKLDPKSGQLYEQIRHVLDTASFDHLERIARAAREALDAQLDESVSCCIETSVFSYGFNNVAFEVAFSDDIYWVARVQHAPVDDSDATIMLSEIATMNVVKARSNIPVPRVFGHQARSTDNFQFPFVLMEFLPGRDVGGPIAREVPDEYLPKVAKQLAAVLFQLENQLAFPKMGMLWCGADCAGPPEILPLSLEDPAGLLEDNRDARSDDSPQTSLEWFYNHRQEDNKEAMMQHPEDPEWNTACWVLKDALSHIVVEDRVYGPFPLCHMDFHHGNLLFDDEYNLTGVLDWSQAQTAPLERLAVSPEFVEGLGAVAGVSLAEDHKKSIAKLVSNIGQSLQDLRQEARSRESPQGDDQQSGLARKRKWEADATENEEYEGFPDTTSQTTLADIFGTVRAEITKCCTYSNPRVALWDGRMVQRLIFGEHVSWEQMVKVFGDKELFWIKSRMNSAK